MIRLSPLAASLLIPGKGGFDCTFYRPAKQSVFLRKTPLFMQSFGAKRTFFVLQLRTLEFPNFCVTRHLDCDRETLMWLKNVTDFAI